MVKKDNTKAKDLTGKVYGRWIVLGRGKDRITKTGATQPTWLCRCACGTEREVLGSNLIHGHSLSCGCIKGGRHLHDLTGKVYGSWTVLYRADSQKGKTMWHCRCACGAERDVKAESLVSCMSASCGCRRPKRENLLNQRFGMLTVIAPAPDKKLPSGRKSTLWLCRCDCGTEKIVYASMLKGGTARSCGCASNRRGRPLIDLTGRRYGHWTVISRSETRKQPSGGRATMWRCRCDCGTIKDVSYNNLVNGSKSCGCRGKSALQKIRV